MNARAKYVVLMHLWRADFRRLQRERLQGVSKTSRLKPRNHSIDLSKAPRGATSQSKGH